MSTEREFTAELSDHEWTGTIVFKHLCNDHCVAEVKARGTSLVAVITCYYEGYGMREYCICVPNYDFGCKLSAISSEWNEEQFAPHIGNAIDRRSLVCAVETIIQELEQMQKQLRL